MSYADAYFTWKFYKHASADAGAKDVGADFVLLVFEIVVASMNSLSWAQPSC